MSERAAVTVEVSSVSGSGRTRTAYSWGEVVVAAVTGRTAVFYDGSPEVEVARYRTAIEAHEAALDYTTAFETVRLAFAAEDRR